MAKTGRPPTPAAARTPKMGRHSSGQARVTLDGRVYYLGAYGSATAQANYDAIVALWMAGLVDDWPPRTQGARQNVRAAVRCHQSIVAEARGESEEPDGSRFYVYTIYNSDGRAIYVGKGVGSRCMDHLRREDFGHIRSLMIAVEYMSTEREALRVESEMIMMMAADRQPLLNKAGVDVP